METIWEKVLVLPSSLALMVKPSVAAILRRPETANSRPTRSTTSQAGTTFSCTRAMSAADTRGAYQRQ